MGRLYEVFARTWPEDAAFWAQMAEAEAKHTRYLEEIAKMVSERPGDFMVGRAFTASAIQTFTKGIESLIAKTERREVDRLKALYAARDIEHSYLEGRFVEIATSNNARYRFLIGQIRSDTLAHRRQLDDRIGEINPGG